MGYVPLEPLPGQKTCPPGQYCEADLPRFLGTAFKVIIVLGGLIAVATIVFAGISYMVSDVVDRKGWARRKVQSAVFALVLLLSSYLILNTINPDLTVINLGLKPLGDDTPKAENWPGKSSTAPTNQQVADCEQGRVCGGSFRGYIRMDTNNQWYCSCP